MSIGRVSFVRQVWGDMLHRGGIEKAVLPNLQILCASQNYAQAQLKIDKTHTNRLGIIHGGVLSTLVDVGGSLALAANGYFMTGVTTDLSTTFLAAGGQPGHTILLDCYCQRVGRTMAFTFVEIKDNVSGKLVARGNHTKYIANAAKSEKNVVFT